MTAIVWTRKVFDDGMHNAVTDLCAWRGAYWLCFRRAEDHFHEPPGEILVLRSDDLETWERRATISTELDDRDPKLLPDGDRLLLFFGAKGERIETRATSTRDGETWREPRRVFERGWWLWRPARFADGFWCAAYGSDLDEPGRQYVDLLRSADGLGWERVCRLLGDLRGNEAALHRTADERMLAFVRGRGEGAFVLEASPPYTDWTERPLDHRLHAPAVVSVGDRLVLAARDRRGERDHVTRLWEWRDGRTLHLVDLPSGGDTSYCGLVADTDASLVVSWYSQHEFLDRPGFEIGKKPAAVYVARVELTA